MKTQICEFFVAGVQHHQLHTVIGGIQVGDSLTLRAEPTNRFDPNAVKIELGDVMLGYVPMKGDLSAKVSARMTIEPVYCTVTEINPEAKTWEQLKVEVYVEDDEVQGECGSDDPEEGSNE